jgi:hypothetical protein
LKSAQGTHIDVPERFGGETVEDFDSTAKAMPANKQIATNAYTTIRSVFTESSSKEYPFSIYPYDRTDKKKFPGRSWTGTENQMGVGDCWKYYWSRLDAIQGLGDDRDGGTNRPVEETLF